MSERTSRVVLVLAGLGSLLFALPIAGLLARAPWRLLGEVATSPITSTALALSLLVSLAAVLASIVLGAPLAWLLARTSTPGRRLLRALVTLPLVLPPVVAGVALLAAFGRRGLLGGALAWVGLELPFTTLAAVLASTFVAAPLLVTTLEAGLAQTDPRLEQVAATLGASRLRILWSVLLPQIRPALLAGMALCWARALGEFGATITFAGNLRGRTQTLPLAIYETLQTEPERAFLLACSLLALSVMVLAATWRRTAA